MDKDFVYYWCIYRSLLFHLLMWSIDQSKRGTHIFVDTAIEKVH